MLHLYGDEIKKDKAYNGDPFKWLAEKREREAAYEKDLAVRVEAQLVAAREAADADRLTRAEALVLELESGDPRVHRRAREIYNNLSMFRRERRSLSWWLAGVSHMGIVCIVAALKVAARAEAEAALEMAAHAEAEHAKFARAEAYFEAAERVEAQRAEEELEVVFEDKLKIAAERGENAEGAGKGLRQEQ